MTHRQLWSVIASILAIASTGCSDREQGREEITQQEPSAAPAGMIGADEAKAILARGGVLVDVREPDELAETGKVKGALNVRMLTIRAHAARRQLPIELQSYTGRPVIFYCRSGRRAAEAADTLRQLGLSEVYNLGGFEDAVRGGLAVETEKKPTT